MTAPDVQSKIHIVRDNLAKLEQIPQESLDAFVGDFRNLDSALHRLQTTIQALIDVGGYLVARLGLGPPNTSRDVIERLEAAGHLPEGSTRRFGPIVGFRNRVVHLYDRVDPAIVYRILREDRGDLRDLLEMLVTSLDALDE